MARTIARLSQGTAAIWRPRTAAGVYCFACLAAVGGCSSTISAPSAAPPIANSALTIEMEAGRAAAAITVDGRRFPLAVGETAVGDHLVIVDAAGKARVYRKPDTILRQIDSVPYLYLNETTGEELITEGCRGEPYCDPATHQLYWTAQTCTNPECPGRSAGNAQRPLLFPNRLPGVWVAADGSLASQKSMPATYIRPCPRCARSDFVQRYDLPEAAQARERLLAELKEVRTARDRARPQAAKALPR